MNTSKKRERVQLSEDMLAAFENLKMELLTQPVLQLPCFDKPFRLMMDASKEGLGAELSQEDDKGCWHPVAYASRALSKHECNYHSTRLEFLALKWAITKQFREYLAHTPFVVCTDNNPLTYVMSTPNLDATGHRWVAVLAGFNFKIEYVKGTQNRVADALSRQEEHLMPEETQQVLDKIPMEAVLEADEVQALLGGLLTGIADRAEIYSANVEEAAAKSIRDMECVAHIRHQRYEWITQSNWATAQGEDEIINICHIWVPSHKPGTLKKALGALASTEEGKAFTRQQDNFIIRNNLLYLRHTLKGEATPSLLFVVPQHHQQRALDGCHWHAGHQGQERTIALLREHFWWPGMLE